MLQDIVTWISLGFNVLFGLATVLSLIIAVISRGEAKAATNQVLVAIGQNSPRIADAVAKQELTHVPVRQRTPEVVGALHQAAMSALTMATAPYGLITPMTKSVGEVEPKVVYSVDEDRSNNEP